jgi:hypothetical protein
MITKTLQRFKVYVTKRHDDDHDTIEDDGYMTLADYVYSLQKAGGIYDAEGKGWVPYHRINYIAREE